MESATPTPSAMPPAAPMATGGMPPAMPPAPPMAMGGMPPAMPQAYAEGGATKTNPIKDFFSDVNVVEAALLALGVATFLYAIYYYKFEMTLSKTGYADLNARMQKIESENAKRKAAEQNANAENSVRRSRKRILM